MKSVTKETPKFKQNSTFYFYILQLSPEKTVKGNLLVEAQDLVTTVKCSISSNVGEMPSHVPPGQYV